MNWCGFLKVGQSELFDERTNKKCHFKEKSAIFIFLPGALHRTYQK